MLDDRYPASESVRLGVVQSKKTSGCDAALGLYCQVACIGSTKYHPNIRPSGAQLSYFPERRGMRALWHADLAQIPQILT